MMRRVLVPAAIVAIVVISFLPALDGQFLNWDDSTLFTKNHDFRGLGAAQLRWMFTTTLAGHYMPLTWLTLGLNYRLGGMSPWGYHLAAILLHAANAVLFYLVARRLLRVALGSPPGGHDSADDEPPGLDRGGGGRRAGLRAPPAAGGVGGVGDRARHARQHRALSRGRARIPPRGGHRTTSMEVVGRRPRWRHLRRGSSRRVW